MKNYFVAVLLILIGLSGFSQEINRIKDGLLIKKGTIVLKDRKIATFKNLKLNNGVFTFSHNQGNLVQQKVQDVYKVTKRGNYMVFGAIGLGAIGFLSTIDSKDEFASNPKIDQEGNPSPVFMLTVGSAVLGGLIGLLVKKEKLVFKNSSSLSFYPKINYLPDGKSYPVLSFNMNLN